MRANEARLEKEVRFAQRVQIALLPTEPPKRLKGVEVAAAFDPAREVGGDFHDYLAPESNTLVVAVGDVSGKGVPAALYSAFAAELVRGRTFRRRYLPERSSPASVLASINTILHQRQLEEYYCTLCYTIFDLKRRTMTMANSGLPYPVRCSATECVLIELPGVPLGSFAGSTYDEVTFSLQAGEVYVFCTDGVFEAMNEHGQEFTVDAAARRRRPLARAARREDRRGNLSGGCRVARRRAAERRHDGGGGSNYRLKSRSVSLRWRPTLEPPNVATSLTRPVTRTCAPRVGVRLPCESTVTSPVPSSTL